MFDSFFGKILIKKPTDVVLDVGGVGYSFLISLSTFSELPQEGESCRIFSHLQVREDALQLFGFYSESEREIFRLLISVSGIGPKLATTVLSGIGAEKLKDAIVQNNLTTLTKISGIGKKTAERMVVELREKIGKTYSGLSVKKKTSTAETAILDDTIAALLSLGYKRGEAEKAADRAADSKPKAPVEELIREALNYIR